MDGGRAGGERGESDEQVEREMGMGMQIVEADAFSNMVCILVRMHACVGGCAVVRREGVSGGGHKHKIY